MKTESIYTVEYFIKKFEAIPEEFWVTGRFGNNGKHCANGHCGVTRDFETPTEESSALKKIFDAISDTPISLEDDLLPVSWKVAMINDGNYAYRHDQPTPKQRILAALYDIYEKTYGRKYGEQEQPKEVVRYKTVVIDSAVKELQETLTEN